MNTIKAIFLTSLAYFFHILGRIIREVGRFSRELAVLLIRFGLWVECEVSDAIKNLKPSGENNEQTKT